MDGQGSEEGGHGDGEGEGGDQSNVMDVASFMTRSAQPSSFYLVLVLVTLPHTLLYNTTTYPPI